MRVNIYGRYLLNLLLGLDQFGNVLLGGDPDETISSRLGRIERANAGRILWSRPWSRLIAGALHLIDRDHCSEAIEPGAGDAGVFDRPSGALPYPPPPPLWRGGNEGQEEQE